MTEYITEDQRRREQMAQAEENRKRSIERYKEIDPIESRWLEEQSDGTVQINEQGFEAGIVRNVPAWHKKALVHASDVEGDLTPEIVMARVPEIASEVTKEPVEYNGQEMPGKFFTVRKLDNKPLGIVGNRYHVIQNEQAFSVLSELVDSGEIIIESALTFYGGKSVAIQGRLPKDVSLLGEEHIPWLLWMNNHSGEGQAEVHATPERGVCANTVRLAKKNAPFSYRIRHTRNAEVKLAEAREALGITFNYIESLKEDAEVLGALKISERGWDGFLASLIPIAEPNYEWDGDTLKQTNKRSITVATNLRESINEIYRNADNLNNIRGTGWGVVQAVVEHEEHHRKYKNVDVQANAVLRVPDLTQETFERMMEMATV